MDSGCYFSSKAPQKPCWCFGNRLVNILWKHFDLILILITLQDFEDLSGTGKAAILQLEDHQVKLDFNSGRSLYGPKGPCVSWSLPIESQVRAKNVGQAKKTLYEATECMGSKDRPECKGPTVVFAASWKRDYVWRFHCSTFFWQPPGWIHFLPSLSVFWGSAHFLGVSMDMSTFWGSNPFYTFVSIKLLEKSTKLQ